MSMRIDMLTLFPNMFKGPFSESMIKRAIENKKLDLRVHNLRDWAIDKHKTVDDKPFGGGAGMVMRVDVIDRAVKALRGRRKAKVILLDSKGELLKQSKVKQLSGEKSLILISGHYEGVDHRVHEHIADEVISIGEYILTGGEIPSMVLIDSMVRLIPGVLGNEESLLEESYEVTGKREYPQYTRPSVYKGKSVPEVLVSGNHKEIKKWRENN